MSLSIEFKKKIDDLYLQFTQFDATQSDRLLRYRNIEPESAYFLAMLIRIQQSKSILEIGTSTGYSTLWLADAAKVTQAKLTTLEIDAKRSEMAHRHALDFELNDVIDFWVGDAKQFLTSNHKQYDFILLDAERDEYIEYWNYLPQLMAAKGVLIVDNVLSHAEQVSDFISRVHTDTRFMTATLNIGAGLFVVTRKN